MQEFDSDFDDNQRDHRYRGAYSGSGTNKGWLIELTIKPQVAPHIDRVGIENTSLGVSVRTQVGRNYWLERANTPGNKVSWSAATNMQGTGISLSMEVPLESGFTEFHRIRATY